MNTSIQGPRPRRRKVEARRILPSPRELVTVSLAFPDWCTHLATDRCREEYPHRIAECGMFDPIPNVTDS
jgi:hypothetical protein